MGRPKMTHNQKVESFWSKVVVTSKCWYWVAGTIKSPYSPVQYGAFHLFGENYAHRVSYILEHGSIPDGKKVLHRCDFGLCVRPDHLFLGTHKSNMKDMVKKQRSARKVNDAQVGMIRRMYSRLRKKFRSMEQTCRYIAPIFDLNFFTIRQIVLGQRRPNACLEKV